MKEPKQAHVVCVLEHVEQAFNRRPTSDVSADDRRRLRLRQRGFARLTIRARSHTLPLRMAGEGDYERLHAPCPGDCQLFAATQV